jgi:hypothetical protein
MVPFQNQRGGTLGTREGIDELGVNNTQGGCFADCVGDVEDPLQIGVDGSSVPGGDGLAQTGEAEKDLRVVVTLRVVNAGGEFCGGERPETVDSLGKGFVGRNLSMQRCGGESDEKEQGGEASRSIYSCKQR